MKKNDKKENTEEQGKPRKRRTRKEMDLDAQKEMIEKAETYVEEEQLSYLPDEKTLKQKKSLDKSNDLMIAKKQLEKKNRIQDRVKAAINECEKKIELNRRKRISATKKKLMAEEKEYQALLKKRRWKKASKKDKLRIRQIQVNRTMREYYYRKRRKDKGYVPLAKYLRQNAERRIEAIKKSEERLEEKKARYSYYAIYLTSNHIMKKRVRQCKFEETAFQRFDEYLAEHGNVRFPQKYIYIPKEKVLINADNELVLIQVNKNNGKENGRFKNEIGKYVEAVIQNTDRYVILRKEPLLIEEEFQVISKKDKNDIVTFNEAYERFIKNMADYFVSIMVFRKWLFIEFDDLGTYEALKCKNNEDAKRLYNELHEECDKDKLKRVVFKGEAMYDTYSYQKITDIFINVFGYTKTYINKIL